MVVTKKPEKFCPICSKSIQLRRKFCSFSCRSINTNRKRRFDKVMEQFKNLQLNDISPSQLKALGIKLMCCSCELPKPLDAFYNNKANTGRYYKSSKCKDCDQKRNRYITEDTFITKLLKSCKSSAVRRKRQGRIECSEMILVKKDLLELKSKQNGRCAISGVKLKWRPNSGWKMASVDRLDNNKGYTSDNIRIVCWSVNQALSNKDYEDFIKMCHRVADNNPRVYEKREKTEKIVPKEPPQPQKTVLRKRKPRPHKRTYPKGKKCMDCDNIISNSATKCIVCSHIDLRKVQDRPSKEALRELLKTNSYCALGRLYGVSDNCIRKWLK